MSEQPQDFKKTLAKIPLEVNHRGIQTRQVINADSVKVMNLLFKAGDDISPHATPADIVFYVIRGKGHIIIGEMDFAVQAGDVVYGPKFIPHGVRAVEDDFELLVVKTPNPM